MHFLLICKHVNVVSNFIGFQMVTQFLVLIFPLKHLSHIAFKNFTIFDLLAFNLVSFYINVPKLDL